MSVRLSVHAGVCVAHSQRQTVIQLQPGSGPFHQVRLFVYQSTRASVIVSVRLSVQVGVCVAHPQRQTVVQLQPGSCPFHQVSFPVHLSVCLLVCHCACPSVHAGVSVAHPQRQTVVQLQPGAVCFIRSASLFLRPSVSLSLLLSLCLSVFLAKVCVSHHQRHTVVQLQPWCCPFHRVSLSVHQSVCLFVCHCASLSMPRSVRPFPKDKEM